MQKGDPIYLDHNATTPLDPAVIEAISHSLRHDWGNPSSSHALGKSAKEKIEQSRGKVATMLNAEPGEIIFMSGGTEANNVALKSALKYGSKEFGKLHHHKPHVIISNVEHDSVKKCLENPDLHIDITYVQVDKSLGQVTLDSVLKAVTDRTCLMSIMHANNETGVLMPISEIGTALEHLNITRMQNKLPRILFHTDAAQSIGKVKVDVKELKVDFLTIVGHKFCGPRIGALYARGIHRQESLGFYFPIVYGGGQERGLRPGTENTPMIVGLGVAAELITRNLTTFSSHMQKYRDSLTSELLTHIPGSKINFVSIPLRLPNTISFQLPADVTSAKGVLDNSDGQIIASLGAACHSGSEEPSDILMASGLSPAEAKRTIRISVGRTTTNDDVKLAALILANASVCRN